METAKYKAVLSTVVTPVDGVYEIKTLGTTPNLRGCTHYIGHPATIEIVEALGAMPAENNYFSGLSVGERAIAFSIKPGKSSRAVKNYTRPHQDVTLSDLLIREIKRLR